MIKEKVIFNVIKEKEVTCLFDSGCTITTISIELANEIGAEIDNQKKHKTIIAGDKFEYWYSAYISLKIPILKDAFVKNLFVHVGNQKEPLIGMDVMKALNIILDTNENKLYRNQPNIDKQKTPINHRFEEYERQRILNEKIAEENRKRIEEQQRQQQELERQRLAEIERQRITQENERKRIEEENRNKIAEQQRLQQEAENNRLAEIERQRIAQENERKRIEEKDNKRVKDAIDMVNSKEYIDSLFNNLHMTFSNYWAVEYGYAKSNPFEIDYDFYDNVLDLKEGEFKHYKSILEVYGHMIRIQTAMTIYKIKYVHRNFFDELLGKYSGWSRIRDEPKLVNNIVFDKYDLYNLKMDYENKKVVFILKNGVCYDMLDCRITNNDDFYNQFDYYFRIARDNTI